MNADDLNHRYQAALRNDDPVTRAVAERQLARLRKISSANPPSPPNLPKPLPRRIKPTDQFPDS